MITERKAVFIGLPNDPKPELIDKAIAMSQAIWTEGMLPVLPILYANLYGANVAQMRSVSLQLFKQCDEAICFGNPTGDLLRAMKEKGVEPKII